MNFHEQGVRLLRLLTRPPRSPIVQTTVYFAVLSLVAALGIIYVPMIGDALASATANRSASGSGAMRVLLTSPTGAAGDQILFDLRMAIVMAATMLVTIPFSWGYMSVRERGGYDKSVVQTLVALPVVVAAIMMIVQSSLALAFALAGVAAAVRFRNTLKDVADATYVFLAIGIGIAAGTGSWTAALVMSAAFTYISVLLWRCNFGDCEIPVIASTANGQRKAPAIRGRVTVDAHDEGAREAVEQVLTGSAKRWKLRRKRNIDAGGMRLVYGVRLNRSGTVELLSNSLLALAAAGVRDPKFTPRFSSSNG